MRYLLMEKVEVQDKDGDRSTIYPGIIPIQYVRQVKTCYGPDTKLLEEVPDED